MPEFSGVGSIFCPVSLCRTKFLSVRALEQDVERQRSWDRAQRQELLGSLEKKAKLAAGFDGMLRAEEGFAWMLLSGRERWMHRGEEEPGISSPLTGGP